MGSNDPVPPGEDRLRAEPGQKLSHYRLVEKIGAGGMGVVFRAFDERLERDVAVKVLPPGFLDDAEARRRFRREALVLSKLNHPNIETVHDFDSQDGVDFLVMEYVPGASLDAKAAGAGLTEAEVAQLGLQLAQGLAAAHDKGVVHRDLKPGNVLLTPTGQVKILDFGVARLLDPEGKTATTMTATLAGATTGEAVVGTLPYMAPEQIRGGKVDRRTDIFALGAVLYELATGKRAFPQGAGPQLVDAIMNLPAPSLRATHPRVSPALEAIVSRALEKDPARRYQTAPELAADLQALLAGRGAKGPAAAPQWRGRSRQLVVVAAARRVRAKAPATDRA